MRIDSSLKLFMIFILVFIYTANFLNADSISSTKESEWSFQGSGTIANLNAVFFININEGWIVGDGGIILHTTDGGTNWQKQQSNSVSDLYDVYFSNESNGVAVGWDGIFHTIDGGKKWIKCNGINGPYYAVDFVDENNGWASGHGFVAHTIDGGQNWEIQPESGSLFYNFYDIDFVNQNQGWIVGDYECVYYTYDGGTHWIEQRGHGYGSYTHCFFIDANRGWLTHEYSTSLEYTLDGGNSWHIDSRVRASGEIQFLDENIGWILAGGHIYFTSDGGQNWQYLDLPSGVYKTNDLFFVTPYVGWVVADNGIILHTISGGGINQKPTITISSPNNGAVVDGIITITGVASDPDGTIQKVEVKIDDGGWNIVTGTTSWSYNWDTTTVGNGNHIIYARSYDGKDYSDVLSITVTVSTPPNQPPTVRINYPYNNQEVKGVITIRGTASDPDGSVQRVEVKVDNGNWNLATGTTSWHYSWNTESISDGSYTIYARSYDGKDYSNVVSIQLEVKKEKGNGGDIPGFEFIALFIAAVVAIWVRKGIKK